VALSSSLIAELLASDFLDWEPVAGGQSGASVFHDRGRQRYVKIVQADRVEELAAERDRSEWLAETDIPCTQVLDWRETDAGAGLLTRAVPGVPASALDPSALRRAWPSVVTMVRALHALSADRCPFDRTLAQMMTLASATVAEGKVVVEYLPESLQHTSPALILQQIETELPVRRAQERADLVVCHGDLCLPNVVVDPATDRVTGLIDLGRLGTADPYGDIALLLATAREAWPDETTARRADLELAQIYGTELDPDRQDFYLRLDALTW